MSNADELMVSEKTAYNYLNAGLFDADKMDCPRIIRMRPRRSTPKLKIDRHCYEGRTYEDFMRFIADNPDVPVVQMDSVKEFLRLKKKLADYFDEKSIEDIFDYIPPQKTNQIFTPKTMVKKMVDMLETENPGCFDDPDKTFIDLYMKSGIYITEIVKRLYQSERMKEQFPDPKERLRHIFEKQVYGLAPTEIIYHIALSYIFGFNEGM